MGIDYAQSTWLLLLSKIRMRELDGYPEQYLSEYFEKWIERGSGIPDTACELEVYLRVVVLAIIALTEDATVLDSKACNGEALQMRRPASIVNPSSDYKFIDPYYYKTHLGLYLRGR